MGMSFLLRGRKGIFARIMGVVWVRADGYFLLFQKSGQHPVEDETCVELRVAAFYSVLVFSTGAREAAQNPAALPMTISLQEHGPRNRTA
jgi:hypothetical protein